VILVDSHSDRGPEPAESLPDALAVCRRYFIGGGREECSIRYDGLILTVALKPDWDMSKLP
jgi:hypothetical protein